MVVTPTSFVPLYAAGRVERWHTADVPAQSLAEHSWGVAMVVTSIYPERKAPAYLIQAALHHDLHESETGDVPATAKWTYPRLARAHEVAAESFDMVHSIYHKLTPQESRILKWADMFELCLYCSHQVKKGNTYASKILTTGLKWLGDFGFPTSESRELYEEIFGQFPSGRG